MKSLSIVMPLYNAGAELPRVLQPLLAAVSEGTKNPEERDLDRVAEMVEACFKSEDYKEGRRAFMEKRKPRFQGR